MISQQLIQDCKDNNRIAQRDLYKYCYPFLYKIAMRYMTNEDEAVEIVTDSYMKILKHLDQAAQHQNPEAWIRRIGINTAIDKIRSNRAYKESVKLNMSETYDQYESIYIDRQNAYHEMEPNYIFQLIESLPDVTREVLNLFAVDGYAHKEIAQMLSISEELSRWHLHKGRKLMAEKIQKLN